ncbi:hypothetical protein PB01_03515 [Psychrobacillus glaciei]|uniref:SWIM-type domain-containing protein n=1 Tax=Psychrobacillus glaciei TaxID=2283160 RepID=A0A5J6SJC8_9BACI|nr:hypothetical protein [Psychrobacillus glaciei]QFF97958.1 hypothetical protein PB01_03515 [Psychrobacillus glaciei]
MTLTSYQKLAAHYKKYIDLSMQTIQKKFHPAILEDEELVRRAAFFVRNGVVSITNYYPQEHRVDFSVRDVSNIEITYHILTDSYSCPCPMHKPCRHIVASIFYLYQQNDSLSTWISDWRSTADQAQLTLLRDERSPRSWDILVDNFFRKFISNYPPNSFYLLEFAVQDLKKQIRKSRPFEREWQPIFDVYVDLVVLMKVWPYLEPFAESNMRNRVLHFLKEYVEEIDDALAQLASKPRLFAADTFYEEMMKRVRHFYFEMESFIGFRKHVYLSFWDALVVDKATREKEVTYLQTLEKTDDDIPLNMVLPYFYIMLSRIDDLLAAADLMESEQLLEWVEVCEKALHASNKVLAKELARKLLPHVPSYLNEIALNPSRVMLIRRLEILFDSIQLKTNELEDLYQSFGLYGIQSYSNLLLKEKRYHDWMALHQSANSSLEYAEACGLSIVKDEAPEVLLPLYHHYAMRFILEKNRYSYKQAIRIWKKMKQVAKKTNDTDFWNEYVETIREKYRRLRALQQEIEKGNLPL